MEEGKVTITRLYGTYHYPAECLLVAAMNPCPCGYYPDRSRCRCTPEQIRRYRNRLDGPLLDRMDLFLEMRPVDYEHIKEPKKGRETSAQIQQRVITAEEIQQRRYKTEHFKHNGRIPSDKIAEYCILGQEEQRIMERYFQKYNLTGRGYHKVLRVARTIADLEGEERIRSRHLTEAVFYRSMDKMQEV